MAHHKMSAETGKHEVTGNEVGRKRDLIGVEPTDTVQYWTDEYLKTSQELRRVEFELDAMKKAFADVARERDTARGTVLMFVHASGGTVLVPKETMDALKGKRFALQKLPQDDGSVLYMTTEVEKK